MELTLRIFWFFLRSYFWVQVTIVSILSLIAGWNLNSDLRSLTNPSESTKSLVWLCVVCTLGVCLIFLAIAVLVLAIWGIALGFAVVLPLWLLLWFVATIGYQIYCARTGRELVVPERVRTPQARRSEPSFTTRQMAVMTYIRAARRKGWTDTEIVDRLQAQGWNRAEIERIITAIA